MLKVEYAPPGTDPTRMTTTPPETGLKAFFSKNWLLLVGIGIFVLLTPKFLHLGGTEEILPPQEQQAAVITPTLEGPLSIPGLPGWCAGPGGAPARPGVHQIGSLVRICKDGAWFIADPAQVEIQGTP